MKKNVLKFKKYVAALLLVLVVISVIGIIKFGNFDKLAGKVKIKDAHLSNISARLSSNVFDASSENPVTSNGFDQINYELKYKVSNADRDVIIIGTLDEDEQYATFKRISGDNITSTLSNNDRRIEIVINNAPANTEITTNILLLINGAPDGYSINPRFQIKESTSDSFDDIFTNPIEVNTNSLRGVVRDLDNEGIPNIIVSIYKNRNLIKETYTNNSGEYIFSDLESGSYTVKINEEIYKNVETNVDITDGDLTINLITERIYPFNLQIHKYITKVDAYNVGNLISRSYSNASTVNFPIEKLQSLSGKVYYRIVVENTGEKEGIISAVKDELPEFMSFNEEENSGFELVNGYIYDRNLEGITLAPGESREDSLVLNIVDTKEAKTYLNRVTADGEIYNHVVYLLDGQTYKEEDVLEGELTTRPADPIPTFEGWYTDSEYTNKYNFNNPVIKNLVLYGKTSQKYRVEFFDKDPETGTEDPYDEQEVPAGDPVTKPDPDPTHTGYTFEHWCKTDLTEYIFGTPVNENLKLITCYKINEYDINFYNYSDTVEKNIKVEYKHLIDETEAPTFDETGYTFLCWSENKSDCFDFTTPVTKNIDLYPTHEKLNNAVVFNDENRITTKEVPYGDTVEPIADQGKIGHSFRCWSEDRENCFDFTTPIIKNTTVYAIYDINKFTVHFIDKDPELGTEVQYGEDQIVDYGNTATRPDPDPIHTGYTFSEWKNGEETYNFETPVTGDITLISNYNINSYPVRFHNDNEVTTVNVQYKHKVTPIESPTKEHHIFKAWLDVNDIPFDFDTLIVDETDLYSSFEEVLAPKVSHVPTMWTNGNVSVTVSKNDSLDDDTGYSYLYKTVEGTYETYESPVTITENTTIIAKAVKSEVGSEVTSHQIVNIDKLNPTVTEFSENAVSKNSATLNVGVKDNESGINYYEVYQDGIKVGEKHFECYSETTFEDYEACRADLPAERITTYTVTGLLESTSYIFTIKAYDKAGNYVLSEELEVTTTTPQIVARLIGYNNQLFEDTIDPDTGDVIVPKEEKYINFESLAEAFDYEDLYDCKNVQCTIQMVTNTNESVEVLEGQDLTLDLNSKIVSGISNEYTIKNSGEFTLIDSTPETDAAGKLINSTGTALLNKTGASFTLGEGYSDREEPTSVVSVTRPYIYGGTVGVKTEENSYFAMYDGKIVAPRSQTPGEGAVSGRVDATEYSYEAVSNTETIDERAHQVVTLSILDDPEARINKSIYYSKLSSAVEAANTGTTTLESEEKSSLIDSLESSTIYGFDKDPLTGYYVNNNNEFATNANGNLIIDLRNEENDKILDVDYLVNIGSYNQGEGTIKASTVEIKVNKYANHGKSLGDAVTSYYHDFYSWDENTYGKDRTTLFKLKKGEIYVLNVNFTQTSGSSTSYVDYILPSMLIKGITLYDEEDNTDKIDETSDLSVKQYSFYYDEDTKTIRSNNQYTSENSFAFGYTEIDLTDKEGTYNLVVNASMESYYGSGIYSYGYVGIGEDTTPNMSTYIYFDGWNNSLQDVRGIETSDYYGYTSYGPNTETMTLTGGKKYYLKYKYYKYVNSYSPSQEEYENANCSDQLIIHTIDLIKKDDSSVTLPINNTEIVDDNIISEVYENAHGSLEITEDRRLTTNNTEPNQVSISGDTIDLTNNPQGLVLVIHFNSITGSSNKKISMSSGSSLTCNNCFAVIQKSTVEGQEVTKYMSYNSSYVDTDNYYYYVLPGGYEYEFYTKITNVSTYLEQYPNVIFDLHTEKLSMVEGNYLNGYYPDYPYVDSNRIVVSSNTFYMPDMWRDSFIPIDLTNYDTDQLLTFNSEFYDYSYQRGYYVYLTDNNRALSYENLFANRTEQIIYMSAQGGGRNQNGSTYSRDYNVVLEKGNIYYLHFAIKTLPGYTNNYISSYGNWGNRIRSIKLTPITERLLSVGDNKVFTGTVDVASKTEKKTTINSRESVEPNVHSGDSTIYDFVYNSETGMYDAQNVTYDSIAAKILKIDLTEATEDKTYVFESNNLGSYNYYTVSDSEDIQPLELNNYRSGSIPSSYKSLYNSPSIVLEKGKVYYVQIATYNSNNNGDTLSFKLVETNPINPTTSYETIKEIREFNEEVDTVQLLKDVNTSNTIHVDYSEEVILDLNGHNLTSQNQQSTVTNEGDLTIIDSKATDEINPDAVIEETFDYSGSSVRYTVPESGFYKLEAWGAQGGYAFNEENHGGYGGYAKGEVFLEKGQIITIIVGGKGTDGTAFSRSTRYNKGYYDGDNSYSYNTSIIGAGGGSSFIVNTTSSINNTDAYQATALIVAGGGGGAYARRASTSDTEPQTLEIGGNANVTDDPRLTLNRPGFAYGSMGATGGGGGWYTGRCAGSYNNPSSSAPGGTNHAGSLVQNADFDITAEEASTDPVANTYKKGNGYIKLTLIKSYNGTITNPNGTAVTNDEKATLTLSGGFYTSTKTPSYSDTIGVINNKGDLTLSGDSVIRVANNHLIGIVNDGTLSTANNDKTKIILDTANCSSNRNYNTVGIYANKGTSTLSNLNVVGKNGVGVYIGKNATLTLKSSNINISDSCTYSSSTNNSDVTENGYDKNFTYKYKYYSSSAYRYDGAIYNIGDTYIIDGTTLLGTVNNTGKLELAKGTEFNDFFQSIKQAEATITDTNLTVDKFINLLGTINLGVDEEDKFAISSPNNPTIINLGTINTNSGEVDSLYNMGTVNSVNTDYKKFYNLHTYFGSKNTDKKGTSTLTGGSITDNILVNEYNMTLDGVKVNKGIINRRNLTVKGDSNISSDTGIAINNIPFALTHYNESTRKLIGTTYSTTSVTLGNNDEEVTNKPSVISNSNNYAITGACNPNGSDDIVDDFEFVSTSSVYISMTYKPNFTINKVSSERMEDYPNYKNLCELNYYDGTMSNTTVTDATDVVDIAITGLASGYDILYDNTNGGKVTLDTLDSNSRTGVFNVGGTSYKSLQSAINNVADGGIIDVTNNVTTANRVTIPDNKNITLNYSTGATLDSFSRDALITNNGNLTVTGDGTNNVLGAVTYENNGTLTFDGSINTNNQDYYYKQSGLFKNNGTVVIDNVTSNNLDLVDYGSLTINNGEFRSNTIHGNNSNIIVKAGYFDTTSNSNYHDTRPNVNGTTIEYQAVNTKPLFKVSRSNVKFDNFDVSSDPRYTNISLEQDLGKFDNESILTFDNSKFGGVSSKANSIYTETQNSVINVLGGTYSNELFYIRNGSTYYQASGTVNGNILASGPSNTINIVSGKLISQDNIAIDILNASVNRVTLGTKGDLNPDDSLKVSKTDPEIKATTYGIVARGTTIEGLQNELYFYDGIVKANDNPIDLFTREYETGYDLVFNRKSTPKEKYLDILPIIHNYTTGVNYYDIQQAFNAANIGDELIFLKDYSSLADTPSLVVAQDKDFTLYLSYDAVPDATSSTGYSYIPYKNDGSSTTEIIAPIIQVNNEDIRDQETGEITEEVPFIINNGKLKIVGAATSDGIAKLGSLIIAANIESVSGARIVINNENATLNLEQLTAINIKNMDTMFKNKGVMNVIQGHFETQQANLVTNTGTLTFDKYSNETASCYNPTFIKVHRTTDLETAFKKYGKNAVVRDLIINSGTMNLGYVYIDTDYTNTVVNNAGTAGLNYVEIEQYGQGNWSFLDMDNSIRNTGTMTMSNSKLLTTKGIVNTNVLTITNSRIDGAFGTGITNSGKLTTTDITVTGGGVGIADTGYETNISGGITTSSEAYYGSGPGTVTLQGSFVSRGQKHVSSYSTGSNSLMKSCSNGTATKTTVSQNFSKSIAYGLNSAVVYIGSGRTARIDGGTYTFTDLPELVHFCGYYVRNNRSEYYCGTPYDHENEDGKNYTVSDIEVQGATLTSINDNGTMTAPRYSTYDQSTGITTYNEYTYGMYAKNSTINLPYGYVGKLYVENDNTKDITLGTKDANPNSSLNVGKVLCSNKFTKGLNYYDGTIWLDLEGDKFCSFADTEDNYKVTSPGLINTGSPYMVMSIPIINNGSTSYTTIEDAISHASSGDVLTFTQNVSYTLDDYDVIVNKDITIDLNGRIVDMNLIISSGTTTITDSGHLVDETNQLGRITNVTNTGGALVIEDGRVNNINNTSSSITVSGGVVGTINTSSTASISGSGSIGTINNTGALTVTNNIVNTLNNTGTASSTLNGVTIDAVNNNDDSTINLDSNTSINLLTYRSSVPVTFTTGTINGINNYLGSITLSGASVNYATNTGTLVINSGNLTTVNNSAAGNITINGGTVSNINNCWIFYSDSRYRELDGDGSRITPHGGSAVVLNINNGNVGTITNYGTLNVLGGEITYIKNKTYTYHYNDYVAYHKYPTLNLGTKDGSVSTVTPKIYNNDGYAVETDSNSTFNYYDGILTSNNDLVIDGPITEVEDNYETSISVDYDEHGYLTGTSSMILKKSTETDTKIACVNGICYGTIQEAIDASVQNCDETNICPTVTIGDEVYFSVELDADLSLLPQYSLTIDLNHHNLTTNGHEIPENITLINGSIDGNNLQSSLARFLSNVFGTNDTTKDIIITKMEDGNALDTAKTYKLYKLENEAYLPIKVDADGAGKYSIGKSTTDMKSIKGRIYLNNVDAGEYMLKDNLDNELEFTIYDDGNLSPNIRENIISEYGHMSASAVATLIISIQTGILRVGNILIALAVIILIIIILLLYKKKSINKKETI